MHTIPPARVVHESPRFAGVEYMSPRASRADQLPGVAPETPGLGPSLGDSSDVREAAPSPSARRAVHTEMNTMSSVSANMVLILHFRLCTPTRRGEALDSHGK